MGLLGEAQAKPGRHFFHTETKGATLGAAEDTALGDLALSVKGVCSSSAGLYLSNVASRAPDLLSVAPWVAWATEHL